MANDNTDEYLGKVTQKLLNQLYSLEGAPSVQIQTGATSSQTPPQIVETKSSLSRESESDPDKRTPRIERTDDARELYETKDAMDIDGVASLSNGSGEVTKEEDNEDDV